MTQAAFLPRQIARAITGPTWHGDAIAELLADITAEEAAARPFDDVHTIAELVGHIGAWAEIAEQRLRVAVTPSESDVWPDVDTRNEKTWAAAVADCLAKHHALMRSAAELDESSLAATVPGKSHDRATMLHGIVEHDAYHGGQIAMLKKVIRSRKRD